MKKASKTENLILSLYNARPDIVDNDKKLLAAVWKSQGWSDSSSLYENLKKVSNPESITRLRRKLHEQGRIKYSKDAEVRRFEQFKEYRDEYGSPVVII